MARAPTTPIELGPPPRYWLPRAGLGGHAGMARAAAACSWAAGLGFGLPCLYAIWYLADRGRVWKFLGFPTYGEGPFQRMGIRTTVPLLIAFVLVCALELVIGRMLWKDKRAGVVLGLALLPFEFAFWIGFALPFGVATGIARATLILVAVLPSRGATRRGDAWPGQRSRELPGHGDQGDRGEGEHRSVDASGI